MSALRKTFEVGYLEFLDSVATGAKLEWHRGRPGYIAAYA